MIETSSIKVLGLANNLIEQRVQASNKPTLVRGHGIAKMLEHNSTLTELDLTYNQIRADSAVAIGKSIKHNKSL